MSFKAHCVRCEQFVKDCDSCHFTHQTYLKGVRQNYRTTPNMTSTPRHYHAKRAPTVSRYYGPISFAREKDPYPYNWQRD